MKRIYIAIDLKSYYASVECVERGLDPLKTNLVVADASRTEKTICLAVSPSLKSHGIPGRARLFEVVQKVKEANAKRRRNAPNREFSGESYDYDALQNDPSLAISYITAVPRMGHYLKKSTEIYNIYLKYVAPEDIHVYSVDEVFIDVTSYLSTYKCTAHELTMRMVRDVLKTTGIIATAGIGTNMYLAKIAMDIVAKSMEADADGVRIAELDEMSYRQLLWEHTPITDFWRVGRGYAKKLAKNGIYTMGDVARCSIGNKSDFYNEDLLYKLFGVNAELLIDHAWGYESYTMEDIKAYRPENHSLGAGQVLHCAYDFKKARLIVCEMTDLLVLDLVDKRLVTDQVVLTVGYDIENLDTAEKRAAYKGEVTTDFYGRRVPKHAHGSINLGCKTSSTKLITKAVMELYDRIVNEKLLVRRINLVANHIENESDATEQRTFEQMDFFTDYEAVERERAEKKKADKKEKNMQHALLDIKKKYGKNAVIKGMNLQEGGTAIDRNRQIGGHKA
ncbi:MAG: DNA methylase [Clostridia bacterium]|nr:DNA methylase [Clostridia bacterium]